MTDFGDIASTVADHGEARKTEDPMSHFLVPGLPTVGALGKGREVRSVEFDRRVPRWRDVRTMRWGAISLAVHF